MNIRVVVYDNNMHVAYHVPVRSYEDALVAGARAMARGAYAWEVRTGAPFTFKSIGKEG